MSSDIITSPLPPRAGIGLRFAHYDDVLNDKPDIGFLEIHSENFFGGGYHRDVLDQCTEHYPMSFHCVGLSLGASEPVDADHLAQVKELVDAYNPSVVSDHISWSKSGNAHLGDLLPLPYTAETLDALCANIDRVQQVLGRKILVENPSTYLTYSESTMSEPDFIASAQTRTGCGLLLDVNNIYVQQHNNALDARGYLDALPLDAVGEVHLAGHIEQPVGDQTLLIDTHSQPVKKDVWDLYDLLLGKAGALPTLIEWDKDIPALGVLVNEACKADAKLAALNEGEVHHAMG